MLYSFPPERYFTPSPHRPPPAFLFPNSIPSSAASKHKLYSFRLGSNTLYATPRNAMCSSGLSFLVPVPWLYSNVNIPPMPPRVTLNLYFSCCSRRTFCAQCICHCLETKYSSTHQYAILSRRLHLVMQTAHRTLFLAPSPYPFSPYRLANITPVPNYPKPPPSPHYLSKHINKPLSRTW
jgi:hypothetical protein